MNTRFLQSVIGLILIVASVLPATAVHGQDRGARVARILWQDADKDQLMWGEVHGGEKWIVSASPVKGFPSLDAESQSLAQMRQSGGQLLVAVRDNDGGKVRSGWVAVDTGVREQPHGDHSHWNFVASPAVIRTRLDSAQGNPSHVSFFNGLLYLTNDGRNGFTRFSPDEFAKKPAEQCGVFFPGGGGHITLAAVDNAVCYCTWIDAEGDNAGRVDVVNLKAAAQPPAYSFRLPSGAAHGAISNSGKVFFAPADGICWVAADLACSGTAESVKVRHISLGAAVADEKPARTGGFVNQRNWVLFTSRNSDQTSTLCLLDAAVPEPAVIRVPIDVADGLTLSAPDVVLASGGKRYAFVFHEAEGGSPEEKLTIVDLDPNGDRNLADAKVAKTIPVGRSKLQGHSGHHSVSFCSEGRTACFTNPGDGTIWIMTLRDLAIRAKAIVGGTPGPIVAIGAPEHRH